MIPVPSPHDLHQRIASAYGSLDEPYFGTIQAAYKTRPYADVERALRERFHVTDDTDLNTDVSVVLIAQGATGRWIVYLSLLGPYAVVNRGHEGPRCEVVVPPGVPGEEADVFNILAAANIAVLPRELLELPSALRRDLSEPTNASLFQALFVDLDVLPWSTRAV